MDLAYFRRLLAYEEWANREVLETLRALDEPPPRAVRVLSHLVASHRLWLGRLQSGTPSIEVWPDLTVLQCQVQVRDLRNTWKAYLDTLDDEVLDRRIEYVNTRGEPWSNTIRDILTHVIAHSAHHRGQIASRMREAGHDPPATDFIHAARRGFIG